MTACDKINVKQDCGCGCGADEAPPARTSVSKDDSRSTGRDPAPVNGDCPGDQRRQQKEDARRRALEWLAANGLT